MKETNINQHPDEGRYGGTAKGPQHRLTVSSKASKNIKDHICSWCGGKVAKGTPKLIANALLHPYIHEETEEYIRPGKFTGTICSGKCADQLIQSISSGKKIRDWVVWARTKKCNHSKWQPCAKTHLIEQGVDPQEATERVAVLVAKDKNMPVECKKRWFENHFYSDEDRRAMMKDQYRLEHGKQDPFDKNAFIAFINQSAENKAWALDQITKTLTK